MKILLVGSNGQLASHYFTSNFKKKIIFFSKKDLDISKKNRVLDICKDLNPKYIINCAAFTKVNNCEIKKNKAIKVNSIGPKNLSLAAIYLDIPIIHFSSDYVFNGYLKRPYNEKDMPDPINFYGKTKLEGENYIRNMRANGEKINKNPRIIMSTIHGAKGGEADKVLLMQDVTNAALETFSYDPDELHRLFYTGATRAKRELHVLDPRDFNRAYIL